MQTAPSPAEADNERRALRWLVGALAATLLLLVFYALPVETLVADSRAAHLLLEWVGVGVIICLLGGVAAWSRAAAQPMAGLATALLAATAAFRLGLASLVSGADLDHDAVIFLYAALPPMWLVAMALLAAALVGGRTGRRGPLDVALAVLVAVTTLAPAALGLMDELARRGDLVGVPRWAQAVCAAASIVALMALAVRRATGLRGLAPGPEPSVAAQSDGWRGALSGAILLRKAEVARLVLLAGALVVGMLAAGARSAELVVGLLLLTVLARAAVDLAVVIGLGRYRRLPASSGAVGPAAVAFVLAAVALALTAGDVLYTIAMVAEAVPHPHDGLIASYELNAAAVTLAAMVAFLWSVRRAAMWLDAPRLAGATVVTMTAYVLSALMIITPAAVVAGGGSLGVAATTLFQLAAVGFTIWAVISLISLLRLLEEQLEAQSWIAPFGDDPAPPPRA